MTVPRILAMLLSCATCAACDAFSAGETPPPPQAPAVVLPYAGPPEAGVPTEGGVVATGPEIVASGQTRLVGLAASATELFWTTNAPTGAVRACGLARCSEQTRLVAEGGSPGPIAFGSRLFWADTTQIWSTDGTKAPAPCNAEGSVTTVTMSGQDTFYVRGNGGLVRMQAWPCSSTSVTVGTLVMNAATSGGALAFVAGDGRLLLCPAATCETSNVKLVSTNDSPVALALDTAFLFWLTGDGRLRRVPHDGKGPLGGPTDLAGGLATPTALAADPSGPNVYVAVRGTPENAYADGAILAISKGGGDAVPVASAQAGPSSVVVAGSHVYWGSPSDGTIRRAPLAR